MDITWLWIRIICATIRWRFAPFSNDCVISTTHPTRYLPNQFKIPIHLIFNDYRINFFFFLSIIINFEISNQKYPTSLANGKYRIKGVRDLTTGFDSRQPDGKALLPASASSQMITFYFDNGLDATIRTSGTEPKIKYYTELRASPADRFAIRFINWHIVASFLFSLSRKSIKNFPQILHFSIFFLPNN